MKEFFYMKNRKPGQIIAIGMEVFDGISLKSVLFPNSIALLKHFIQAAAGLQWLHAKNIMHRDINPSNIMLNFSKETVKNKYSHFI